MCRAHWSSAISVPPSLSRHPSSPLSSRVFHLVFNASFPHPHSDLYRWMDCYPPTPPPNLPGSLLEFPAARQSLFSQVIAQGILIKVKICCWEVTFQTSCDFRCEIKWADFPVSDKHPVTDEGYFKESAHCSDPSRHHLFGITSARMVPSDSAPLTNTSAFTSDGFRNEGWCLLPLKRLWLKW